MWVVRAWARGHGGGAACWGWAEPEVVPGLSAPSPGAGVGLGLGLGLGSSKRPTRPSSDPPKAPTAFFLAFGDPAFGSPRGERAAAAAAEPPLAAEGSSAAADDDDADAGEASSAAAPGATSGAARFNRGMQTRDGLFPFGKRSGDRRYADMLSAVHFP